MGSRRWSRRTARAAGAVLLIAAACTSTDDDSADNASIPETTSLTAAIDETARLRLSDDGAELLESAGADFAWRTAAHTAEPKGGIYLGHELLATQPATEVPWIEVDSAEVSAGDNGTDSLVAALAADGDAGERRRGHPHHRAGRRAHHETDPDRTRRRHRSLRLVRVRRPTNASTDSVPRPGRPNTVARPFRIWVVEQGLGKKTPDTPEPAPPVLGDPYDSYMPMPWFASSEGYGVSLDTNAYSTFELCTDDHPDSWRVTSWDNELSWYVLGGDSTPRPDRPLHRTRRSAPPRTT